MAERTWRKKPVLFPQFRLCFRAFIFFKKKQLPHRKQLEEGHLAPGAAGRLGTLASVLSPLRLVVVPPPPPPVCADGDVHVAQVLREEHHDEDGPVKKKGGNLP